MRKTDKFKLDSIFLSVRNCGISRWTSNINGFDGDKTTGAVQRIESDRKCKYENCLLFSRGGSQGYIEIR